MQRLGSQPTQLTGCAHISSPACVVSIREGCPILYFQSSFPVETPTQRAASRDTEFAAMLFAHHRHHADGSNSGKSKGTCTGLGQINAAASNIRPSVRDPDRDGMAGFLVGDFDFGTKGKPFVRRRHGVIVKRDAARSFGSTLRRVSHGVHRCDTIFSPEWNAEQTKCERGDQTSHADPQVTGLDPSRRAKKVAASQRHTVAKRRLADQTCSGRVGS